ncbi:hypothetical protein WA026_001920 [Henosepilachna vigintioctopunctata]|uniref:G-protein coupled receptors family 2 profile 2 domain-containing protein n=1 Tax=Henosepilachna vigintioctopunctata TaxID=420089 RepID=A0AAW1UTB0_9CUCU
MKYNSKPWCSSALTIREHKGNYVVFTNGSLFVSTFESFYHPNDYCLDYNAVRLCKPDSERPLSEVRKFCGFNASFSNTYNGCKIDADVKPKIEIDVLKRQALTIGYPLCNTTEEITLSRISFNSSKFFSSGRLWVPEHTILLPPTRYCLDHIVEHTDNTPGVLGCREDNSVKNEYDLRCILYPIGLALSTVFLATTLACGFLLPTAHHVLHWRCQTNYVLCLLIGFAVLCIVQLHTKINLTLCVILAVTMHFFTLAAFFWLNTMCFNIWWTFRDLRPQNIEKSQERCRLRLYRLYSWGIHLLIVTIEVTLDSLPDPEDKLNKPRLGENKCWFESEKENFLSSMDQSDYFQRLT